MNSKWFLIGWFYCIVFSFVLSMFSAKDRAINLLCFLCYILGFEVLARGIGAAPFIPHEIGKYVCFFGFLLGLALGGPISKISIYGCVLILLSIPGLMVAPVTIKAVVFNYLGILTLFMGVIFCSKQIVTYTQFKEMARIMVYSIFTLACFIIFRASTFEKVDYGVTANYESAGGAITNQVATLLGTGISIIVIMYLSGQSLFRNKLFDLAILSLFVVRGLLSFSRGGMISAGLAIILMIVVPKAKAAWQDHEIKLKKVSFIAAFLLFASLFSLFYIVNNFTNNMLLYRYQGKTARSLQTGFANSVDVDQISSGRYTVMLTDLAMFLDHPALGVGVGQSKVLRPQYGGGGGFAAHLEYSRLLAEHGMLGAIIVIMIYIYPFVLILYEPNNYKRIICTAFLVMALSATFHAAMRTMITPLLFAITFLKIVPDSYDWRAHLASRKKFLKKPLVAKNKRLDKSLPQ